MLPHVDIPSTTPPPHHVCLRPNTAVGHKQTLLTGANGSAAGAILARSIHLHAPGRPLTRLLRLSRGLPRGSESPSAKSVGAAPHTACEESAMGKLLADPAATCLLLTTSTLPLGSW
jgi:hypothetical protein